MIESPTAIGVSPIVSAIAPPSIEFLRRGEMVSDGIDPLCGILQLVESVDFDLSMADDIGELFMRPDVVRQGSDIEIADEDARM